MKGNDVKSPKIVVATAVFAFIFQLAAGAAAHAGGPEKVSGEKMARAPGTADMTDGEVRKIDKEARKITIRHGEIKNLEMPPMTMVFQVTDPALLDRVRAGDKIRFKAEKSGGAFVVTEINKAK